MVAYWVQPYHTANELAIAKGLATQIFMSAILQRST